MAQENKNKYVGLDALQAFLTKLEGLFATKTELDNQLGSSHTHDDRYYTELEIDEKLDDKSEITHNHNDLYADINHNHDENYAGINHNHEGVYSEFDHNHDGIYAIEGHNHDGDYANINHNHEGVYSEVDHSHDDLYAELNHNHDEDYADINHNHDGTYCTPTEVGDMLEGYALANHNHEGVYSEVDHNHNDDYYTKTDIDNKGYLSSIPDEYITETELTNKNYVTESELTEKGYLTSVPSEYVTETELNAKGYLTSVPSEYVTETELATKGYLTSVPSEYVTETELNNKGYLTSGSLNGLASTDYVDTKVADIVNSAPETLDTLNELAAALGNDKDFATTVAQQIGEKADKEHEHSEYITETELAGKGYLTSIPDEYITETELNNKKYLSEVKPKDVIFDYDIVVSHPIGSIKPEDFGGKSAITLETTGQSLEVVLRNIFGGELQPQITQNPQYSFTASEKHIGEVGEEFNAPKATFRVTSVGEYTYDNNEKYKDTGVTFSGTITGGYNTEEFTNLGYNEKCTVAYGAEKYIYTETPKTFNFSGQYSYTEGKKLTTNLGNETDVFISPSVSNISIPSISSGTYTGYRKIFVGTMDSHVGSFASEQIRELNTLTNLNEVAYADGATKTFYVCAYRGTALVVVAYPIRHYGAVEFEYLINGAFTDVKAAEIVDYGEVQVEGANGYASETYHVYAYKPKNDSGVLNAAQTDFRITVK